MDSAAPTWLVYVVPGATVALLFVTIVNVVLVWRYTVATRRMVDEMKASRESQALAVEEMRRSRESSIRPFLVPYVQQIDHRQPQVHFGVKNVGHGPALVVDVVLRWGSKHRFRLRCPVIEPGAVRLVTVQRVNLAPDVINPEAYPQDRTLALSGTCRDVAATVHAVDTTAPLADNWEFDYPEAAGKITVREALDASEAEKALRRQGEAAG